MRSADRSKAPAPDGQWPDPALVSRPEIECPTCGAQVSPETDWCPRGHFARWDDDGVARPPVPVPEPRLSVAPRIQLAFVGDAPAVVQVIPGHPETLRLSLCNQSPHVQRLRIRVDGLPDGAWSCAPMELGLNPWHTQPPFEEEIALDLLPGSGPVLEPGARPIRLVVEAAGSGTELASVSVVVEVAAVRDFGAEVAVVRRLGFRTGRFRVLLHNRGTTRPTVTVEAAEDDRVLRFDPKRSELRLAPQTDAEVAMRVRTRRWRWTGPPRERAFTVRVTADGAPVDGM